MANVYENATTLMCLKVGRLLHDNKHFDRTCPRCRGMYSSYTTAQCPKCGAQLVFITFGGTPLAISEGTIELILRPDVVDKFNQAIINGYAVPTVYRFKLMTFADRQGILTPHHLHKDLRKGTIVKLITYNHPEYLRIFETRKKITNVENLTLIYNKFGDTINILTQSQVIETTVSMPVKSKVTQAPASTQLNTTEINKLRSDMEDLFNRLNALQCSNQSSDQSNAISQEIPPLPNDPGIDNDIDFSHSIEKYPEDYCEYEN